MIYLYNGNIHTQDEQRPVVQEVLVEDNRIIEVGDGAKVKAAARGEVTSIDLGGKTVLPGFSDTHFHFYEWAVNYENINLAGTASFGEMEEAVTEKAASLAPGEWVLGNGFNESDWPENRMPDRNDLDRAAPDHPVCLWRCDLHLGVANSRALELAGIDRETPDPPEGKIARDGAGNPTGVLRELALNLIRNALPVQTEEKIMENMKRCIRDLHALGVTSVQDVRLMGGKDGASALKLLKRLHETGDLNMRCHVSLPGEKTDEAAALGLRTGIGDDQLRLGHLKFFADGGMGARTAWMIEPYNDAEYGMPLTPVEEIKPAVEKAHAAGLSVMVHSIGDRTCREIIAMFEQIENNGGEPPWLKHRIEHLQMVRPEDLDRLAELSSVIASCQPNNLSLDISMIDQCVGERGRYTYPLREILDRGIPLLLSSDAPVCDPYPISGIYSAVTRKRMDRTPIEGWYPDQRLTVEEAVKGYTVTPAQQSGFQDTLGRIAPGRYADMIVLDRDIYTIPPEEIKDARVDMTVFDGQIVYERE